MFFRILTIIAPVFVCAAVGFIWARMGKRYETKFVTRLIMNVGAPCLVVSAFNRTDIDRGALADVGLGAVCVTALVALAALIALRALRFDIRTYFPSIAFQNTGNMGMPLCLFAFGPEGLALGSVVFMWVAMANFTIGISIVTGEKSLRRLTRMPLIYATIFAVFLAITGWKLPGWVANTVDLLGGLTIPLMLLTLGVSLATLGVKKLGRSTLIAFLRIGFGFAAGLLVAKLLGLTGATRGVIILQASMPSAVFNYLMAARYERGADDVAGAVTMSTLMSLVVLPLVLWYLL